MSFNCLLAKSPSDPEHPAAGETLVGHVRHTLETAVALLDGWGERYLRTMGLPETYEALLRRAVLTAVAAHDMGKAARLFQNLLRRTFHGPMPLPHEVISLLIVLQQPQLERWLFCGEDPLLRPAVLWAVGGHHLRFDGGTAQDRPAQTARMTVHTGHPDFQDLLALVQRHLKLPDPPALPDLHLRLGDVEDLLRSWLFEQHRIARKFSELDRRLIALVKGLLIAADLVASTIPRQGLNPAEWAAQAQRRVLEPADLAPVIAQGLKGNPARPFQQAVAESPGRVTLVRAGCGTGKTTAAYLWAARHARGRKLFFAYPTTGTATQGYTDYALPVEALQSVLVHSRAAADIAYLLRDRHEEETLGTGARTGAEERQRDEALSTWGVPLVVCTVDTVVGLVQNQRRALFGLPSLLQGAFVFDEIHLYDDRLFECLLRFITALPGASVLLMTASLQPWRQALLEERLRSVGEKLAVVEGPAELERLPRYVLHQASVPDALSRVAEAVAEGQKVLWVVNTVERAMALAEDLSKQNLPVHLYHSRYEYRHRLKHHEALIQRFGRDCPGPAVAVTTQVAEVSLDVSADLLVTELAPPEALIQRLGRLNRFAALVGEGTGSAQPHPSVRSCLVVRVEAPAPYSAAQLEQATAWLAQVGLGRLVSQWDLARALEQVQGGRPPASITAEWLDGGPVSVPGAVREAGSTVSIIREEVADEARASRQEAILRTIPMLLGPVAKEIRGWDRIGPACVAPAGRVEYDERWGAKWDESRNRRAADPAN